MVYEYAIDPEVLADINAFHAIWNQIGAEKGRLIAKVPEDWQNLVREQIKGLPDGLRKSTALAKLYPGEQSKVYWTRRRSTRYDRSEEWLCNIMRFHGEGPFHGIVADENPGNCPCFVHEEDAVCNAPENPFWHVDNREHIVPKRPECLAEYLAPLLEKSKYIKIIDPFIDLGETRFRNSISAVVTKFIQLTGHLRERRIEIHTTNRDHHKTPTVLRNGFSIFRQNLPITIPNGVTFLFDIWEEVIAGYKIEDRYLISDITGIEIRHDWGCDGETDWRLTNLGPRPKIEMDIESGKFRLIN